ncbi:hypothetical protein BD779DRAFT_1544428 [Infundibulicybe gibba]|nr:hypothetical protein BD779DRAFT_1544428 [Infundibulicybe gibba]
MPIVQFAPFSSLVHPSFWHKLTELKIDVHRLSDEALPIRGAFSAGRSITDRETGNEIALDCHLSVASEGFGDDFKPGRGVIIAPGTFKNFNTIEDFKATDKTALFNQEVDKIWNHITTTRNTDLLNQFLLITYADLKKYKYYYWFAFPAFVSKPAWEIDDPGWRGAGEEFSPEQASDELAGLHSSFIDPSASATNPGWPLRNLLAYLRALYPSTHSEVPSSTPIHQLVWKSRFGIVSPGSQAVGWERNLQGKLGPRVADLAPMMDPVRLANQAVDLNLKLMRWRILPSLNLEKIADTKCLLLGAGLGSAHNHICRSARVSFSNPVRQPLFEFEDCLNGGKPKAECAAERLKKIWPGINATGHSLSIPMPGHPIPDSPPSLQIQAKETVEKLESLIDEHDVVFLLMDSRESRWLPTIVMNVALGFDTFLVMRHGARGTAVKPEAGSLQKLGCYYCNDIVAPADSLTDRTLDQMCTVTRPGLASIAGSTAVELLVSYQRPGASPSQDTSSLSRKMGTGLIGAVPHQLRGFLAQFRNLHIIGAAYDRCTGCSDAVIDAYKAQGFAMLLRAFNEDKFLEQLTGLDKLYEEGQKALETVDWEEEGEEDF